jgi:hypothetical protein
VGKGKREEAAVGEPTNSGKNYGGVKGKEEKSKGKGAGKEGKEGDQGSEKGAGSEGKGNAKGKGGAGDGGTGAAGATPLEKAALNLSKDLFPDTGEDGRTRGDDLAYLHYTVPDRFTPEMKFICSLPLENLSKWFGEYTWEGLLKLCVKQTGRRGAWRISCPVDECNKHWDADNMEEAEIMVGSLYDHVWQRAMTEYAKGYFGTKMRYPTPWWWFQINAIRTRDQMNN